MYVFRINQLKTIRFVEFAIIYRVGYVKLVNTQKCALVTSEVKRIFASQSQGTCIIIGLKLYKIISFFI